MSLPHRQLLLCVAVSPTFDRIKKVAEDSGIQLLHADNPTAILQHPQLACVESIVVEFREFGEEASSFLEQCRQRSPATPVIVSLQQFSAAEAFRFAQAGVFRCFDPESSDEQWADCFHSAHSEVSQRKATNQLAEQEPWQRYLIGQSPSLLEVIKIIRLVASRRCTVLISGETGTGKEMAARALHMAGARARRPMVAVNCSAIPEDLIEAELFGHVKGAFTGATNHRTGRFEQAHGGTLFLDEIGELPIDLQAKLLRVLQEREIQRIGSNDTVKIDVRIIAATNADLLSLVRQGKFREDLYYRLNVVPILMPPLRGRVVDIPLLVRHFLKTICEAEHLSLKQVSAEGYRWLSSQTWPGNVRQLQNIIEKSVVLSGEREYLQVSDFTAPEGTRQHSTPLQTPTGTIAHDRLNYAEALRQFELAIMQQVMEKVKGNKTLAADFLQLPRTTLVHKLRVLDFSPAA